MEHDHSHMEHLLHEVDIMTWVGAFSVLTYSFFMSLHCIAMCGPLVCAKLGTRAKPFSAAIWLYNFGRLISYVTAGAILGRVGAMFSELWSELGFAITFVLAAVLALQGLRQMFSLAPWTTPIATSNIVTRVTLAIGAWPSPCKDFTLGLVTVFLPCMTLTPALVAAAATGEALHGLIVMSAFFAGTLPAMVAVPLLSGIISNSVSQKMLQRLSGTFLLIAALITVARNWH